MLSAMLFSVFGSCGCAVEQLIVLVTVIARQMSWRHGDDAVAHTSLRLYTISPSKFKDCEALGATRSTPRSADWIDCWTLDVGRWTLDIVMSEKVLVSCSSCRIFPAPNYTSSRYVDSDLLFRLIMVFH